MLIERTRQYVLPMRQVAKWCSVKMIRMSNKNKDIAMKQLCAKLYELECKRKMHNNKP